MGREQESGGNFIDLIEGELFTDSFTLSNIGVSARRLQNWSENGLLPESDRGVDENHKFSFVGLIWLKLVFELRKMGLPLHIIKEVKKHLLKKKSITEMFDLNSDKAVAEWLFKLFSGGRQGNKEKFIKDFSSKELYAKAQAYKISVLYLCILDFLKKRTNVKLIIFETGHAVPVTHSQVPDPDLW